MNSIFKKAAGIGVALILMLALVLSAAVTVFGAYKDGTYSVGVSCSGGSSSGGVESAAVTVIGGRISYITVTMSGFDHDYCYDPVTGAKVTSPAGSDGRLFYINYPGETFSFKAHINKPSPAEVIYTVSLDLSGVPDAAEESGTQGSEESSDLPSEEETAKAELKEKLEEADGLIAKIGNVTIGSKEAVAAARAAVDAFSGEEQRGLKNLAVLEAAEKALKEIEKKISDADALIEKIGDDIGLESEADIEAARRAVDALTEDESKELKNLTKLKSAEDIFKEINEAAGKEAAKEAQRRQKLSYIAAGAVIAVTILAVVLINVRKAKKQ